MTLLTLHPSVVYAHADPDLPVAHVQVTATRALCGEPIAGVTPSEPFERCTECEALIERRHAD